MLRPVHAAWWGAVASTVAMVAAIAIAVTLGSSGPAAGAPAVATAGDSLWQTAVPVVSTGDSLWQRAVLVASTGDSLVPGLVVTRMETLGDAGQVKSVTETTTKVHPGSSGAIETDVVKVLQDGRDITAERKEQRRKEGEARKKSSPGRSPEEKKRGDRASVAFGLEEHPFLAGKQDEVEYRATGDSRSIDGRTCLGYSFTRKWSGKTTSGLAWLEVPAGTPRELQYSTDPLPKHVKEMSTTLFYVDDPPGWRASRMVAEGTGRVLFLKKHLRFVVTLSEYWRLHPSSVDEGARDQEP
jgi:hypothetical protein